MATNLSVWRPFEDFMTLREAMDRLFEESFVWPFGRPRRGGDASLAVNMYETSDAVVIEARVPGVDPDALEITATEDSVTIKGHLPSTAEKEESKNWTWHLNELWYGNFSRTLPLYTRVQVDKVDASFKNGLLTLTIPKAEEVKPKSIKVKVAK